MLYDDYLEAFEGCPFCGDSNRVITDAESCYLTYALAPYIRHHLLIVPKKHKTSLFELDPREKADIDILIEKAEQIMKALGHTDFTVIVREGKNVGKSIGHLHYHIIPDIHIGNVDHDGGERVILSDQAIESLMSEIKTALPSL